MDPHELVDIEEIKQLKAKYCQYLDRKMWDEFASIWLADAELFTDHAGPTNLLAGRDAIVSTIRGNLANVPVQHYATNPIIELTSSSEATGSWCALYMNGNTKRTGHGHYHERYEKHDGRWLYRRLELHVAFFY